MLMGCLGLGRVTYHDKMTVGNDLIYVGMPAEKVKEALGDPDHIKKEGSVYKPFMGPSRHSTIHIWTYNKNGKEINIFINEEQAVTSIVTPRD